MGQSNSQGNSLIKLTVLAFVVAAFDYIVRTYTLGWTEAAISQWTVFLSPLLYFVLFTQILFKLRPIALHLSKPSRNVVAALIIFYSIFLLAQVFLRRQGVGSARYSIVFPLFISGIPLSILTFSLFFRKPREIPESYLICLAAVFWFVMPIGIDTLYITQGGYRGPGPFQIAVISTSYDMIQYIAGFALFTTFVTIILTILVGVYRTFKSNGIERIYSLAISLSIFALSIQFANWGGFVWD